MPRLGALGLSLMCAVTATGQLVGCGQLAQSLQPTPSAQTAVSKAAVKNWAYVAIVASDNDLEEDADAIESATERSIGLPGLFPLLYLDRPRNNDSSRVFLAPSGLVKEKIGELDSENPQVVRGAFGFAAKEASIRRRILVLADHGGGIIRGIMSDEHRPSGARPYQIADYAKVLRADPVDILYFDACLMQMVEVGYDLLGTTDIVLGSESEINGSTLHLDFLRALAQTHSLPNDQVAGQLTKLGARLAQKGGTLSATRNAKLQGVADLLAKLSVQLTKAMSADRDLKIRLRQAIGKAQAFVNETDPHYTLYNSYRDLADVMDHIAAVQGGDIATGARSVAQKVRDEVVIDHIEAPSFKRASGLTIYAPADDSVDAGYLDSAFARHTGWGAFLVALNSGGKWSNPVQRDKFPRAMGRRARS